MAGCETVGEALVINVGDEELDDCDLEKLQKRAPLGVAVVKALYWYKKFGYEGEGVVVYQDSRREWHIDNLTHCSCFGPCHDGFDKIAYSRADIKKLLEKEDYYENGGKEILDYLEGERPVEASDE